MGEVHRGPCVRWSELLIVNASICVGPNGSPDIPQSTVYSFQQHHSDSGIDSSELNRPPLLSVVVVIHLPSLYSTPFHAFSCRSTTVPLRTSELLLSDFLRAVIPT